MEFTKGKWSWKRFSFAEHLGRGDQIEIHHLTGPTSARMIAHIDSELLACSDLNDEDTANAKELVRRWNAFEEGGMVEDLVKACKEYITHLEIHNSSEHPKANMFCTACPEFHKNIEAALAKAKQRPRSEK